MAGSGAHPVGGCFPSQGGQKFQEKFLIRYGSSFDHKLRFQRFPKISLKIQSPWLKSEGRQLNLFEAMEGTEEDLGYQSTEEDEFHLTTSDEFCDGAGRARRRSPAFPPVMEELDLEELKLWDEEAT